MKIIYSPVEAVRDEYFQNVFTFGYGGKQGVVYL